MNMTEKLLYIRRIFKKCFGFRQFLTSLDALYLLVLKKVLVASYSNIPKKVVYHILN